MGLITQYDYDAIIKESVKQMVTDQDDLKRIKAERYAKEEIESYLNFCYDTARLFGFNVFVYDVGDSYGRLSLVIDPSTGLEYVCIQDVPSGTALTDSAFFVTGSPYPITYSNSLGFLKGDSIRDSVGVTYICIQDAPPNTNLNNTDYFFLARNQLIVMLMVDISIYHYHARIHQKQVPQTRIDRYLDAIDKLKRIRRKEMNPALPLLGTDEEGNPESGVMNFYSNPKRNNCW